MTNFIRVEVEKSYLDSYFDDNLNNYFYIEGDWTKIYIQYLQKQYTNKQIEPIPNFKLLDMKKGQIKQNIKKSVDYYLIN